MSASLVYGLVVETDDLLRAALVYKWTEKAALALRMMIARQSAGQLRTTSPNICSISDCPVEVLEVILDQLLLLAQNKAKHPCMICECCEGHLAGGHLRRCRKCKHKKAKGRTLPQGCKACEVGWLKSHDNCDGCVETWYDTMREMASARLSMKDNT
jgi:hypothetical protein